MIINRSFKDFKFRHRSKKNQIIYTSKKVKNDDEVLNLIDNFLVEKNSFIFESVEKGKIKGRYTIFGKNPDKIWEFNNNNSFLIKNNKKIKLKERPDQLIEKIIEEFKFETPKKLPKICSLISGYFSYDSIRYIEKIPNNCKNDLNLPDVRLLRPKTLVIYDNLKKEIFYIINIFNDEKINNYQKKYDEIKKELSKSQVINTKLTKDLNKSNSKNTSISAKLNKDISDLQTKINSSEEEKSNLSSKLSLEINTHKKIQNKLSKNITRKASEIKALKSQLIAIEKEVSTLREAQTEHNIITSNLERNNAILHSEIGSLNSESNTLKQELIDLKVTNTDLKNLFVLRDFEANNIKTSNLAEKTSTSLASEELVNEKKMKENVYSVQFGVYMTLQPYRKLSTLNNIWHEITQHGTYVYLSGKFKSPEEATTHKNTLVSLGYTNAFVVTLNK